MNKTHTHTLSTRNCILLLIKENVLFITASAATVEGFPADADFLCYT